MTATVDELGLLHRSLCRRLMNWLESDECTPAHATVAVTFLKNNGIVARVTENTAALDELRTLLSKPVLAEAVQLTQDERLLLRMGP